MPVNQFYSNDCFIKQMARFRISRGSLELWEQFTRASLARLAEMILRAVPTRVFRATSVTNTPVFRYAPSDLLSWLATVIEGIKVRDEAFLPD